MNKDLKNYYEVLEVPVNASQEEIYEGYVRAKNAYSGDSIALYSLISQDECDEMLDLVEQAYSVLSVPVKRKEYDHIRGLKSTWEDTVTPATNARQDQEERSNIEHLPFDRQQPPIKESFQFDERSGSKEEVSLTQTSFPDDASFSYKRQEVEVSKITAQKRFSLEYSKDPEFEQEIENTIHYTGEFLRRIREYKQVTVERMADMTKISKTYIRCIENDDVEKLPALAYVRGFVYQYAKCLKLSPELVATSYLHHLKSIKNAS